MPGGAAWAFHLPTHSLRSMVDPPRPNLSGQYARSTGTPFPSHHARCSRAGGPRTPFGAYEVASDRDPGGPPRS